METDPSVKDLRLSTEESRSKNTAFGAAAGLMIILGYPGELITELIMEGYLVTRRQYRAFAAVLFLYIVYELLIGRAGATQLETDPSVNDSKHSTEESSGKSTTVGAAAGLMVILGYPGEPIIELIMDGDLGTRLQHRAFAADPFLHIVYEWLIGVAGATELETNPSAQDVQLWTEESRSKCTTLGALAGLLIILGYPGELIRDGDVGTRRQHRTFATVPFL